MFPRNRKSQAQVMLGEVTFSQNSEDGHFIKSLLLETPSFAEHKSWLKHPAKIVNKLHELFPGRYAHYKKTSLRQGVRSICEIPAVMAHVHEEHGDGGLCE